MDELISILITLFKWFTNSQLTKLIATHRIYVSRRAQHYRVRSTASNISHDSIEAAYFWCHGCGLNALAVDLRVTTSGEVANAQLSKGVVAPYVHFVVLHRADELLAEGAVLALCLLLLVALHAPLLFDIITAPCALIWMVSIIHLVSISPMPLASSSELLIAVLSAQKLGFWSSTC